MKLLITGGAGFIGSHVAEAMACQATVTILDDLSSGSLENLTALTGHTGFRFIRGSVLDSALVERLVRQNDVIIHFAAALGVRRILSEPLEAMRTNIEGTEILLKAAARYDRKVMIASTSEVYGKNCLSSLCENADSILGSSSLSRWSYATAKKLDEFLALGYHRTYNLPVVVLRFFNIVGPRQTGRYGMVLPTFVRAALTDAPIRVFGDGRQTRNFTYVGDCVDAVLALLNHPSANGEIFNIGGLTEISISDLARRVKTLTGSSSQIEFIPYEEAYPEGGYEDMQSRVPCICKIHALTGWKPRTTLNDTILDIVRHEASTFPKATLGPHILNDSCLMSPTTR